MAFHFWHVVCKNDPDNNFKQAQFKSGKIHAEMFLHSITFMLFTILSANTCHFFFSCKLVRIYKTHTLEKKQSVFSSLLSDYKAYKSYKTRFITWNKYKIMCQYDKWKSRLWAVVCRVKAPVETWATIRLLIPVSIPDCRSGRRGSMDVINNWLAVVCFPPSVFLSPPRANRSLSTSQSDHGFHSVKDKCHY